MIADKVWIVAVAVVSLSFVASALAQEDAKVETQPGQAETQPAEEAEIVHVVHLGDSIMDAERDGQRVDTLAQAALREFYDTDRIVCHNVSKGGSSIARFMREGSTYETRCLGEIDEVDFAVIQFGVNDEDAYGPEEFRKKLAAMCDRIERDYPGVRMVLCTSVKTKDRDWWAQMGEDAEEPISRKYYAQTRQLAAERGYVLVDIYQKMVDEMKAGNWDMFIRNQELSQKHYGRVITDDSRDAERVADGTKWFKDVHPNARGLKCIADLEVEMITRAYPDYLPKAGQVASIFDLNVLKGIRLPTDMPLIDAHAHYGGESPVVLAWMAKNKLKIANIGGRGRGYDRLTKERPERYGWITALLMPEYDDPQFDASKYADEAIARVKADVADGAIGVKVFKSVGMRIKKPDGSYLQIDDPVFEPVFAWMEQKGITLIAHVADPKGMWMPLGPDNPYSKYCTEHPSAHMFKRKDIPSHEEIMAARDRVVARHPKLRFVGAHFGCLEYDVGEVAKRFDAYPNFAVDTSGWTRIIDLSMQDRNKVRDFMIAYQDRIMFGTDRSVRGKSQLEMNDKELAESLYEITNAWQAGWDYYATDNVVVVKGYKCPGLALPQEVLEKIFYTNAKKWYPGL